MLGPSILSCPAWPDLTRLQRSIHSEIQTAGFPPARKEESLPASTASKITACYPSCHCSVSWPCLSKNQGNRGSEGHKNASRVWPFYCRKSAGLYNSIYKRKMTLTRADQTNVTSQTSPGTWFVTYIIGTCCQVNSKYQSLNISQSKGPPRAKCLVTCMQKERMWLLAKPPRFWQTRSLATAQAGGCIWTSCSFSCHHVLTSPSFF